ncbi:MAG: TonB-dependent receptor domain-containing protein [Henriciella sp.]
MSYKPSRTLPQLLCGGALACFAIAAAQAQEDPTEAPIQTIEEEPEDEVSVQDKIVVTGSLLQRTEFSSAAPIQVLTAETATLEGLISTADIIQGSSIAAGSVQLNNQFGGFVVDGGLGVNTVSLRGLGDQRTLVLINGRRPGPSGVGGAVGAFDLNLMPSSAVTRVEILKDGASTVYGSDAVGGVVNVITRTAIDRPELTVEVFAPFESGGESFSIDGAYGFNFETGSIALSAQYTKNEDLSIGDRDYLACSPDLIKGADGNFIDREDRGINAGTPNENCNNIYANTYIDVFNGVRYIPSPDGVTTGPIPGYRPRTNSSYLTSADGQSYFEDDLYDERVNSGDAINGLELLSLFATSDFTFDILGGVNWKGEALYTQRTSTSDGWRQFFPFIGGTATGFEYDTPFENPFGTLMRPVVVFPSNTEVEVEYVSIASTFEGGFSGFALLDDWAWSLDFSHSHSDGDRIENQILIDRSGDWALSDTAPTYNPFDPSWIDGSDTSWYDDVSSIETSNTIYKQTVAKAVVSGPLFELPAGELLAGFLVEGREYSIDDQPSENSVAGNLWGSSSALPTEGEEDVFEMAAEFEIPLLRGAPLAEELTVNLSGRTFNYATYGTGDVWKAQANWQIVPALRLRATKGTTFRAPALFETFQGATTAFASQAAVDPCIDWGESTNENLRTNCASLGIPENFGGGASSATIVSEGGGSFLTPETSEAETIGIVVTPPDADFSFAIDYFNIEVENQIAQLGSGQVVTGCYVGDTFPNVFCDLIQRNDANALQPFAITEVRDIYVNINSQATQGLDFTLLYERDFDFGAVSFEGQATFTDKDLIQLFDASVEDGFEDNEFNGTIGDPEWVWNTNLALERGDFTYSWFMDFIGEGDNSRYESSQITYQGIPGVADRKAEEVLYHGASVRWEGDSIAITAGIRNLFDEHPSTISDANLASRRGIVPVSSGYDLRGRRVFVRLTKEF